MLKTFASIIIILSFILAVGFNLFIPNNKGDENWKFLKEINSYWSYYQDIKNPEVCYLYGHSSGMIWILSDIAYIPCDKLNPEYFGNFIKLD